MRRITLPVLVGLFALVGCSRAAPIKAEPDTDTKTAAAPTARVDSGVSPVAANEPRAGQEAPPIGKEPVHDDTAPPAPVAPPAPPPGPRGPRDPDAVREATFRYMFGKNASGQKQSARVYCLEVENSADPSAAFLARFKNVAPHVTRASACDASADKGVIEKSSGKQGLIFRVDTIIWVDDDHAEVGGGYYEAGLSASGNTYYLERKNGAWHVTKDVMHWIS
jgi:hypothetical protein